MSRRFLCNPVTAYAGMESQQRLVREASPSRSCALYIPKRKATDERSPTGAARVDTQRENTGNLSRMAKERAEPDVQADDARVDARETGGVADDAKPDQASTTGTTPDDEYVGRVAGSDPGYAEETGAERRAANDDSSS
jgi:hypothetical protein